MGFSSPFGEDRWIAEHLSLPERGFYVDIGAMRPDVDSNTAFLRDRGWFGLAIDGHPDCARWWQNVPKVRYVTALLGSKELARQDVIFALNAGESRIVREGNPPHGWETLTLRPRLLESVFKQEGLHATEIDFLSIDVEGMEYEVMKELRLDDWRPKIIVAEYNTSRIGEDYRLMNYLLGTGHYTVVHRTMANLVYVYRE